MFMAQYSIPLWFGGLYSWLDKKCEKRGDEIILNLTDLELSLSWDWYD